MSNNDQNIREATTVAASTTNRKNARINTVEDCGNTKPGAVHVMGIPEEGDAVATIIPCDDEDVKAAFGELHQMAISPANIQCKNENGSNLSQLHHSNDDGVDSALENGEYATSGSNDNNNSDGLVVACPVHMNDDSIKIRANIPTAVAYDNETKPKSIVNNHRLCVHFLLIISAFIFTGIGIVLGITLVSEQKQDVNQQQKGLKYRETIGIYENIARLVKEEELIDVKSPYRKALHWITFDDPLLLTPDHPRFMQRYILSYFYFATSTDGNWTNPCRPDSSKKDECKYIPSCDKIGTLSKPSTRWLSKQNECEWAGIKCDQLQQVTIINLSTDGMTGFFPYGITLLPYLHELYLECGTLSGPIADRLNGEDITLLSTISLKNNTFTGTIPEQLIQSHSLTRLIMQSNQLNGTIPRNLYSLFDLRVLDLGSNRLAGPLPDELWQLRNIIFVSLDNNNFIGTIPSSYGQMQFLNRFEISYNGITGSIPKEFGNLNENLNSFRASHNRLSSTIPDQFWNANKLNFIKLNNNALTGTISNKIQQLKQLIELSISNNLFTGTLPSRIGTSGKNNNAFSFIGFLQLQAYGNQLNGTVPEHLCNLVQDGTLEELELDCAPTMSSEVAEIFCPIDCCTLCCTPDGKDCK